MINRWVPIIGMVVISLWALCPAGFSQNIDPLAGPARHYKQYVAALAPSLLLVNQADARIRQLDFNAPQALQHFAAFMQEWQMTRQALTVPADTETYQSYQVVLRIDTELNNLLDALRRQQFGVGDTEGLEFQRMKTLEVLDQARHIKELMLPLLPARFTQSG